MSRSHPAHIRWVPIPENFCCPSQSLTKEEKIPWVTRESRLTWDSWQIFEPLLHGKINLEKCIVGTPNNLLNSWLIFNLPGSQNPAKALYIPLGNCGCLATKHWFPLVTKVMATGDIYKSQSNAKNIYLLTLIVLTIALVIFYSLL